MDQSLFNIYEETYTACYCEENVYKLCQKYAQQFKAKQDFYAVFITNENKQACIKQQKKGDANNDYIIYWDYHVIFVHNKQHEDQQQSFVYDFDTKLDFCSKFDEYFLKAFAFKKTYPLKFRVINGQEYLDFFASDRSHMLNSKGKYNAKIPNYPNIVNKNGETNNLMNKFVNINDAQYGQIFTEKEFYAKFRSQKI